MPFKLLLISGALRAGSFNTKLVHEAARHFGPADITFADLRLPLYDGDLEDAEGLPTTAQLLQQQMLDADAVVIATPEYNSNLSGVLKNALDWVSRGPANPLTDKPVAILSAAAGRTGGARAQYSLRHCLTSFQPRILQGPEVQIAGASREFDATGRLTNERYVAALTKLMQKLRDMV
ncbi:MAG: NAD(P)H-dependent oxidoreductase [Rhodobacteraceae bacterium]|nr:NAD(P)H-dependent oxidoreductase [Paracoccaceae bacterium]